MCALLSWRLVQCGPEAKGSIQVYGLCGFAKHWSVFCSPQTAVPRMSKSAEAIQASSQFAPCLYVKCECFFAATCQHAIRTEKRASGRRLSLHIAHNLESARLNHSTTRLSHLSSLSSHHAVFFALSALFIARFCLNAAEPVSVPKR